MRPKTQSVFATSGNSESITNPHQLRSRYIFDSCLRRAGGRFGAVWLKVGQFWPDGLPVVRAHFLSCDLPTGKCLDTRHMCNRYRLCP